MSTTQYYEDPTGLVAPIGFCIDNTGSEADDAVGIKNISKRIIESVFHREHKVPSMHLVTFNDRGESSEPAEHTEVIGNTNSRAQFTKWLDEITFSGGGDSFERATYGLRVLMKQMVRNGGKHGVIFLITDTGTKNLEDEQVLLKMKENWEMSIFVILAPRYLPSTPEGEESMEFYKRISYPHSVTNMDSTGVADLTNLVHDHISTNYTWFFISNQDRYLEPHYDSKELRLNKRSTTELSDIKKEKTMGMLWRFDKDSHSLINKLGYVCHIRDGSTRSGAHVDVVPEKDLGGGHHEKKVYKRSTRGHGLGHVACHDDHHPDLHWTSEIDIDFDTFEDVHKVIVWNGLGKALDFEFHIAGGI